jgi:hypothetical protein
MTDGPNDDWRISLSHANFLGALKALKLGRHTVSDRTSKLYIAFVKGEAVFCLKSMDTRWPASGTWTGCGVVKPSWLLSFLKQPPAHDSVEIVRVGDRMRVDTLSIPAEWIDLPVWLSPVLVEAHFNTPELSRRDSLLYCPECGKRKGAYLDNLQSQQGNYTIPEERVHMGGSPRSRDVPGNRRCAACGHEWIEPKDD